MNTQTAATLNAINRAFYAACAADFDVTRAGAWKGWLMALPQVTIPADRLRVLDVGCGNGRLGAFLCKRVNVPIEYHGIDFSTGLLDAAQQTLSAYPNAHVTLEVRDLVESPPDAAASYDLVCAFGLLHHIPGEDQRARLVRTLAEQVAPGGTLIWTEWRFQEYERFRERMIPTPPELQAELEPGDFLLDWGGSEGMSADIARRYCHYIDDAESARLITAAGLELVTTYRADGHTRDANQYVILRQPLT